MYEIIDREEDTAGKWRIRVAINGATVTFKFASDPADEEVQAEAARYDAMMQEQSEAEAARYDAMMQEQSDAAPNTN